MRKLSSFLAALVAGLFFIGCGFVQDKKDAEVVLARHFQALTTNGVSVALADYDAQFFQKNSKEDWTKALNNLNRKLGTYESHSITRWNVFKKAGTAGNGSTVSIECSVKYAKHTATEKFVLFKGIADTDFKIKEHEINSTALLTE